MNIKPKKSLGQNFLNDSTILSKIVDIGDISEKDIILEIGPGTGNLTEKILNKKPKEIHLIEKDERCVSILKEKFGNNIKVENKDILNCFNNIEYNVPVKIFGNLPYNISTKILTNFIKLDDLSKKFKKFIFIFQKEVADRIVAKENTKNYGRLSIITSWKLHSEKILDIDPICFFPKPKVWSSLIMLTPKLKIENLKKPSHLEHLTNIFFNHRRKMIRKPMKQLFIDYEKIAKKLDINLNLRPQNLTKNQYYEICKFYEKLIQ